jgi:hypothetical protein
MCCLLSVVSYQVNLVIHLECRDDGFFLEMGNGEWEIVHDSNRVGNKTDKLLVHKLRSLKGGTTNIHPEFKN